MSKTKHNNNTNTPLLKRSELYVKFQVLAPAIMKIAVFWVAAIALMMEAVSTSERSVNFYQITRCNNPEDRHL
jgi:hypothetical protein